jgi:hypothetical protein
VKLVFFYRLVQVNRGRGTAIVMLHVTHAWLCVEQGNTSKSYGFYTASLMGVPEPIVKRAKKVANCLATHVVSSSQWLADIHPMLFVMIASRSPSNPFKPAITQASKTCKSTGYEPEEVVAAVSNRKHGVLCDCRRTSSWLQTVLWKRAPQKPTELCDSSWTFFTAAKSDFVCPLDLYAPLSN